MGASVTLVCRGCGRRMPYFRSNDPSLPAWVETISMSGCDLCHDGDRMSEDWLDADGNAPDPDTMTAPTEGRRFVMPIQNRGGPAELAGPFVWEPTKEDRRQADNNHGQTLERLADRGGMAWSEMAFIILHQRYDRASRVHTDQAYAKAVCRDVLIMRERAASRAALSAPPKDNDHE